MWAFYISIREWGGEEAGLPRTIAARDVVEGGTDVEGREGDTDGRDGRQRSTGEGGTEGGRDGRMDGRTDGGEEKTRTIAARDVGEGGTDVEGREGGTDGRDGLQRSTGREEREGGREGGEGGEGEDLCQS